MFQYCSEQWGMSSYYIGTWHHTIGCTVGCKVAHTRFASPSAPQHRDVHQQQHPPFPSLPNHNKMLSTISTRRGVRAAVQWWRQAGAARAFGTDVPDGHDPASLTGDKCNIAMKRRVDITLRQDLKLAEARTWDKGVEGGFAASGLGDLLKVCNTFLLILAFNFRMASRGGM